MTSSERGTPGRGPTVSGVLAAEWTKLTGVRSTAWVAAGTVGAAAALAFGLGLFVRDGDRVSGASLAVSGSVLAQLGVLVLGVLVGAGEFSTGTATTTFTAVPRRLPVLAGQALVTTAVVLVTAPAALVASALVTTAAREAAALTLDLADPDTLRMAAGFVLDLTGVALLGVGTGALLRRPAAALMAGVVLLVVVDQYLAMNPGRVADTARALLPGSGSRMLQDHAAAAALDAARSGPDLGTWGGGVVLAAWVVAVLAAAAYRLARHDVT